MKTLLASALTAAMLLTGSEGLARRRAVAPPPPGPSHIMTTMEALDDLTITNHEKSNAPIKFCIDDVCTEDVIPPKHSREYQDIIQKAGKQAPVVVYSRGTIEARTQSGPALHVADAAPVTGVPGGGTYWPHKLITFTEKPSTFSVDLLASTGASVGGRLYAHPGGVFIIDPKEIEGYANASMVRLEGSPHVAAMVFELPTSPTTVGLEATAAQDVTKGSAVHYNVMGQRPFVWNPSSSTVKQTITYLDDGTSSTNNIAPQATIYYDSHLPRDSILRSSDPLLVYSNHEPIFDEYSKGTDEHDMSYNRSGHLGVWSDTDQQVTITQHDAANNTVMRTEYHLKANSWAGLPIIDGGYTIVSGNVYSRARDFKSNFIYQGFKVPKALNTTADQHTRTNK